MTKTYPPLSFAPGQCLGLIGLIAAVPFYLLKGGREPEPGSYSVEDVKAIKEDERK